MEAARVRNTCVNMQQASHEPAFSHNSNNESSIMSRMSSMQPSDVSLICSSIPTTAVGKNKNANVALKSNLLPFVNYCNNHAGCAPRRCCDNRDSGFSSLQFALRGGSDRWIIFGHIYTVPVFRLGIGGGQLKLVEVRLLSQKMMTSP